MPGAEQPEREQSLAAEQRSLERGARMGPWHWGIVGCSVLITLAAWQQTRQFVHERAALRFEQERSRVVELVQERLERYEDLMRAGVGVYASHGSRISQAQWGNFVASVDLQTQYAGIDALSMLFAVAEEDVDAFVATQRLTQPGFRIHPDVDVAMHLPVTYIEPMAGNEKALGLDLMYEETRVRTILASRDSGEARITGPITLIQDETRTPGFVFMMPLYRGRSDDQETREANFTGLITAPFVANEMMQGVLSRDSRHVAVRLSDGDIPIYDELSPDAPDHDAAPMFRHSSTLELYGRRWRFDIQSDLTFRSYAGLGTPTVVLVSGLLIDTALLLLFLMLSNVNRRALDFAGRTADELKEYTASLRRSNGELESFAHVVSHDLKTPLRGIGDLVEYLGEDLEPMLAADELPDEVGRNLQRLDVQQRRMSQLIDGILGFSAVGREQVATETLDVAAVLAYLANELGIDDGTLEIRGECPVFDTQALRFQQVMYNLLGNAVKHHDDPASLRIVVDIVATFDGWSFTVSDNGPGIEPAYRDSVFEVFKKLRSKDEVEGSGVGLSIVRRSVELVGGTVVLDSLPGQGASFTITWPDPARVSNGWSDPTETRRAA